MIKHNNNNLNNSQLQIKSNMTGLIYNKKEETYFNRIRPTKIQLRSNNNNNFNI